LLSAITVKMHISLPLLTLAAVPLATAQLHELAKKAGKLYFGTATDNGELNNTQYVKILSNTKEFGQLTPSNGQKWMFIEPTQNEFNFTNGEVVTSLAKKNKQLLRCHNLVWHSQLADWVTGGNWTKETLTKAMVHHIEKEAAHWKGQCYAWDVLNEALNEDGSYRQSTFYQVIGPEYIRIAFAAAAKADPHAKLYYNDYNMESVSNKTEGARKNIVKYLQDANIRIDGLGMQGHLVVGSSPSLDDQIENIKRFEAMGLEVAYTELDIRMDLPETPEKYAQQSEDYKNTVGACVQSKKCVGVTVWDFYDPFSWIPDVFPTQGFATLYFANFTRHPAYYGVVEALKNCTKPHLPSGPPKPPGPPGPPGPPKPPGPHHPRRAVLNYD